MQNQTYEALIIGKNSAIWEKYMYMVFINILLV